MSQNKKILFVEDNQLDRIILTKFLDELSVDYFPAETAEEFLPLVKKIAPDLCLVDLNLKRPRDGEVLVKAIRNILGDTLPIIIISGEDDHEAIEHNLKNGADDFVCKPIDKALLTSKISNFLSTDAINSNMLPVFSAPAQRPDSSCINVALSLIGIGETNLHFSSPHKISDGCAFKIHNTFLKPVFSKESLDLKVISFVKEATGQYTYICEIIGITYQEQMKMRSFIVEKR